MKGYVNIGDTVVLLSGVLFGPLTGLAAGGLGSALADLLLGYGFWAPWTLLIKGLEGWPRAGPLGAGRRPPGQWAPPRP